MRSEREAGVVGVDRNAGLGHHVAMRSAMLVCAGLLAWPGGGCGKSATSESVAASRQDDASAVDAAPFVCPEGPVSFCGQTIAIDAISVGCQDQDVSDLRPLSCLPNLTLLDLSMVPASDLSPLAGADKITWLRLMHLDVHNIEILGRFSKLRNLGLDGLPVRDLSPLAGLRDLRTVTLTNLPARDLSPLANHGKLSIVSFYFMELPDLSPLATLPITDLYLMNCAVDDLGPLGDIESLEKVDIEGTVVPAGQLEALKARRPALVVTGKPGTPEHRKELGDGLFPTRGWKAFKERLERPR